MSTLHQILERFGRDVLTQRVPPEKQAERIKECLDAFYPGAKVYETGIQKTFLEEICGQLASSRESLDYFNVWRFCVRQGNSAEVFPDTMRPILANTSKDNNPRSQRNELRKFLENEDLGEIKPGFKFWFWCFVVWCDPAHLAEIAGGGPPTEELLLIVQDLSLLAVLQNLVEVDNVSMAGRFENDEDEELRVKLSRLQGPDAEDARLAELKSQFIHPSYIRNLRIV
jgi:hypothetical protein